MDSDVVVCGEDVCCVLFGFRSGVGEEFEFELDVYGVLLFSFCWYKEVGGRREFFMVEGIENLGYVYGFLVDD